MNAKFKNSAFTGWSLPVGDKKIKAAIHLFGSKCLVFGEISDEDLEILRKTSPKSNIDRATQYDVDRWAILAWDSKAVKYISEFEGLNDKVIAEIKTKLYEDKYRDNDKPYAYEKEKIANTPQATTTTDTKNQSTTVK